MDDNQFTEDVQKYRIFFKDLIVLAKETMFLYDNNIDLMLIYTVYAHNDKNKSYHFTYDIKIKKWILLSYENVESVIFNPKVNTGIKEFLQKFDLSDLILSHKTAQDNYAQFNHLRKE